MTGNAGFSGPHIHSKGSLDRTSWGKAAALFPVLLAAVVSVRLEALKTAVLSLAGFYLAGILAALLWKKKMRFSDGVSFFTALLFAMMLPPGLPFWAVLLGACAAGFAGKEIFGDYGGSPFHPALIGILFLQICFPLEMMKISVQPPASEAGLFFLNGGGTLGGSSAFAVTLAGVFLILGRLIVWEIPFLYLIVFVTACSGMGLDPFQNMLAGNILLTALFVVTDPVTGPVTRTGKYVFSVLCALLTVFIRKAAYFPEASACAVLIANALVPWIDGCAAFNKDSKSFTGRFGGFLKRRDAIRKQGEGNA